MLASIRNKVGGDVRAAIRAAKRQTYNEQVAREKPKIFEGNYRICYADPPWKYVGLNQADEYGHAEGHYHCLADEELAAYRDRMEAEAFHRAHEAAIDRLVREGFGLPTIAFGS